MAKFCTRCGQPLEEGKVCSCSVPVKPIAISTGGFWENVKKGFGINNFDLSNDDAYETNKQIIPDCVKSNESEIPVKQYRIATLRNRILGIPYAKAIGRLQITNKRVIFRAPGKSIAGRTSLQHEFSIDEIAGIESRREYTFNIWDLLIGMLVCSFGGLISMSLISSLVLNNSNGFFFPWLITLIVGILGCIPFYTLKNRWITKIFCLGVSVFPLYSIGILISSIHPVWGGFLVLLGSIFLVDLIIALILNTINPNLVLVIKTKSASDAIDIRRKKVGIFGMSLDKEDHTGYAEILPEKDAEKSIREIGALINDIQKLGDFGIEKWKSK